MIGRSTYVGGAFLQAAGNTNGPGLVAEVPLQLSVDSATGERGELHAKRSIESIDRLDQPELGNLAQILVGCAPVSVSLREVFSQRSKTLDESVPIPDCPGGFELIEQLLSSCISLRLLGVSGVRHQRATRSGCLSRTMRRCGADESLTS